FYRSGRWSDCCDYIRRIDPAGTANRRICRGPGDDGRGLYPRREKPGPFFEQADLVWNHHKYILVVGSDLFAVYKLRFTIPLDFLVADRRSQRNTRTLTPGCCHCPVWDHPRFPERPQLESADDRG